MSPLAVISGVTLKRDHPHPGQAGELSGANRSLGTPPGSKGVACAQPQAPCSFPTLSGSLCPAMGQQHPWWGGVQHPLGPMVPNLGDTAGPGGGCPYPAQPWVTALLGVRAGQRCLLGGR